MADPSQAELSEAHTAGSGGRARYGQGAQQIQTVVTIATEFLKQTYAVGKNADNNDDLNVYRVIPNCLGGTLCLIEYLWGFDKKYYDCCVIIRGENEPSEIYDSIPDVMKMIANEKVPFLYKICEPRVVIGFLTLFILFAGFALWWFSNGDPLHREVPEPYRAGLTAVIGYWLGQAFPAARPGSRSPISG